MPPRPVAGALRLVTLTTDFGDSAYVGAMKGAILSASREARIVDNTHAVAPQDVVGGALALLSAAPYFPSGTIHVAVVDPGVGTERGALLLFAGGHLLIGPDNGLLLPAADRLGITAARRIANARLFRREVSSTFHGRDVFGPVAGALAGGLDPAAVGPPVDPAGLVRPDFGQPTADGGTARGRILALDRFGNLISNLPAEMSPPLGARCTVELMGRADDLPMLRTFAQAPPGKALLLVGSAGLLEVCVNGGSAAERWGATPGTDLAVRW